MILNCILMDVLNQLQIIALQIIQLIQWSDFNVHRIWPYEVHECPNVKSMEVGYQKFLNVKVRAKHYLMIE